MVLDYSKIKTDADGRPLQPDIHLQTLDGTEIGVVPYISGLKLTINYSDVSEIEFDIPYYANGEAVPLYSQITSYKRLYTENYGIYIIVSPEKEGDGVSEVKHVHGYSLEKLFDNKQLYLSQGTYRFCNPVNEDGTILGMILELDSSWSAGTIDSKFITMYRTFDEYDGKALSFCYNEALDKFGCVFVFDPYQKKIHVKDAYSDADTLPIYLDYDNLVQEVQVEEISDEIVTKLHPYGSDGLNIRGVNPTGADYIVNLDYFIANGDLNITPDGSNTTLAEKVEAWEAAILTQQTYYTGLVAARASQTGMKLAAEAQFTELQNELDKLTTEQNVLIQGNALDPNSSTLQTQLKNKYNEISAKKNEIANQETRIDSIQALIDSYNTQIRGITEQLSYETFFTAAERLILDNYLIEEDLSEETFVCTDLNTTASGDIQSLTSGTVTVTNSTVTQLDLTSQINKKIYTIRGGNLLLAAADITADIISGTLEISSAGAVVASFYLSSLSYGTIPADGGLLVVTGTGSVSFTGTSLSASVTNGQIFFTVNASDYQRYSVQQQLYDFATEVLDDSAWPVYEFSMNAANFMFLKGFEAFRDKVVLGSAVYLRLGSEGVVTPALIGLTLDFSDMTTTELTFSNRYQRKNGVETLGDMIRGSYSSSRTFSVSKYLYDLVGEQATDISRFMSGSLDAAVNRIKAAQNQSITIDSNGIAVTDDSGDYPGHELRLVSNMLAMTDDNWQHSKLAIGYFQPSGNEFDEPFWGVNADVIAGKLVAGQNLVIQANKTEAGSEVVTFKVDSTGAYLYNARFDLKKSFSKNGQAYIGRISMYPVTGFVGGATLASNDVYTYNASTGEITGVRAVKTGGTNVGVTRIAELGSNVPLANFWIDMYGDVYLKGRVIATDGVFSGTVYAKDGEFSGSVNATAMYINGKDVLTTASDGTRKIKDNFVDLSAYYTAEGVNGAITSQAALTLQAAKDSTTTALTSYYTKEDADSVISSSASATLTSAKNYTTTQLGNYYTKSATNSRISSQATATLTSARNYTNTTLTSYYTSEEADKKIAAQAELTLNAAKDSTTTALTSYYTKEEADSVITSKGYVTMEATANYVKTELGSYYTKSDINRDYYTRAEVKTYCDENCATAEMVAKVVDSNGNVNAAEIVASVNKAGSDVTINANHIDLSAYYTSDEIDENYYTKAGVESYCGKNFATTTLIAEVVDPDTGEVNAGGIVVAINNGDRDIVIDADRINLNGVTTMSGLTKVSDKLTLGDGATSILYMESGTSGSYIKGANNCIEIEANKVILPDPSYVYVGSSTLYSYLQESGGGTAVFG